VGDRSGLETASERGAAADLRTRSIEVAPGTGIGERARAAIEGSDRSVHALVTEPAVPLPDWLPSVVPLVSDERDAGVVGARILSDDGALEEAGGILDDGRRRRRGEGDSDPDRPEYRFVQRVDFCSPPLLATRRDVFERLGGFDAGHRATADAVIDFSLRAGRSGVPVYYQPRARVVAMGSEAR
jgi:O-antigen biosynthesis protein